MRFIIIDPVTVGDAFLSASLSIPCEDHRLLGKKKKPRKREALGIDARTALSSHNARFRPTALGCFFVRRISLGAKVNE